MKFIKKNLKLLVFIITCVITYLIYITTINEKNINYISLGDGYAKGINSYNQNDYGYSLYLKEYLKSNNRLKYHYNNFSYHEAMIKDIYKDILINKNDKNKNSIKQSLRESNLLTISIGLNDLIYKQSINKNIMDEEKIIRQIIIDLDQLIEEIKKYYKHDIYLIGYYNFYPQNSVERKKLDQLNNEYKKYCKRKQINYIEITSNLQKYYENHNSIYPNSLGYQQIYKEMIDKIYIN